MTTTAGNREMVRHERGAGLMVVVVVGGGGGGGGHPPPQL